MWQFYAFAALNFNNGAILVTNQKLQAMTIWGLHAEFILSL